VLGVEQHLDRRHPLAVHRADEPLRDDRAQRDREIGSIKDALERSMAPGSQSFEQALYYLISSGKVAIDEAMANSDSPTNLHWLLTNAPKVTEEQAAQQLTTGKQPGEDISSIKLNLDALG
jgi:twitching motility protein PilU